MSSTQSINDYFFDNSELVKSYLKSFHLDKIESDQKIIEELNQFIQQNPENQDAYMLRGMVFTKINQCQNAQDDFTKAIQLDSVNSLFYLQRGHILKVLKMLKEAEQDYSKAIEIQPQVADSYYYKGLLLKEMELLDDALVDFIQAINLDPNNSKFYVAKGDLLYKINKIDQSLDCYNKAIEINQQNKVAYKQRGNLFYYMEQYENALDDYSTALKLDSNYIAAQYNKGLIFEQLNRLPEALEAYNQTIKIDFKYVNAYIGLGIVYKNMKQIPYAIDNYTKALQLDPTLVFGYNARGNIYSELNQLTEALNDYSKALQLDPNYVNAYNGRGNVHRNMKKQTEAIDDYTKAIELDPKYANAYNGRGCVFSDMQRLSEALNDLQRAVELSPDNPLFLVNLGKLQIATQQYDEAELSLAKAQNIFNQSDQQQKMIKFNLSQKNLNHITKSLELLSEIRTNFRQVNLMIQKLDKQNNLIKDEKTSIQTLRDNILTKLLKNFGEQSNEQLGSYQNINELLFQLIFRLQNEIDEIQNNQNQMQNQINDQEQDINNLKQNDVIYITETIKNLKMQENQNNYLFYLSFCSRVLTHIEACLLIETNLLQTKNDAGLETQTEHLIDNINNVAKKFTPFLGGIPIVGSAIESIFELLDYGLEYYKEKKFQAKIKKIVSVMKSKSATQSERESEIQIASFKIIEQITEEDLRFEKSEYFKAVQKIVDVEIKSIPQANNPFWILGIENSIIVLKYIEQQSEQIVPEQKELRDIIVQSLKQYKDQRNDQFTQQLPKAIQVRSSSVCCQIF